MIKRFFSVRPDWQLPAVTLALTLFAVTGCGDETAQAAAKPDTDEAVAAANIAAALKPEPAAPNNPRAAKDIEVKPGFQVELLHQTDKNNEGSWVSLCKGPNGTLYAAAQYAQYKDGKDNKTRNTIFQIKPAPLGDFNAKTQVIPQPVEIFGAQGLYYGFGALYVMDSRDGLMRVTDSDGDGLLDKKEQMLSVRGGGEHSTHSIVPSPDGKSLYIIAGNMTPLPEPEHSRPVYKLWDEDQTIKREPDGNGHASGVMAPGGWIGKIDPDGKNFTLINAGYRNPFDMAFDQNGELFAYDSDMEWDLGLPWYRPTRVNHAVSGAEFGWRFGSGKWPTYFEDSLPAAVEIGPGSPVGVTFGYGAKFPTQYQSALFILDWTYGTIYAVHLKPDGASYTGTFEPFLYGKPLPLTDAVIADDGAMYFTTGGRRGESAFYRVSYYGVNDQTAPKAAPLSPLAELRRELEALHMPGVPADKLGLIWDNLNSEDRFVRFAARVALEHMPADAYIAKAKAETDPLTRTSAGLALARHKSPAASEVLMGVDLGKADDSTKLAWLRAVGVHFARAGQPDDAAAKKYLDKFAGLLPSENPYINTELVRLRVSLNDPTVIKFALDLMSSLSTPTPPWLDLAGKNDRYGAAIIAMRKNPPPSVQFGIAFMLRNIKDGWTMADRQAYFSWLNRTQASGGGNSQAKYLNNIRNQAIATLTESEKLALADLTEFKVIESKFPPVEAKGPGRQWTTDMAAKLVETRLKPGTRDFDRGVGLYQSTLCVQCHRVNDFGGAIGPDLSTVANKFSVKDLLRHTIEPSLEVSEQYAFAIVTKKNGEQVVGRIMLKDDKLVKVKPNVLKDDTIDIPADQVASIVDSTASPMPQGLVNALSVDELADLTAYLQSAGNPDNALFKKK